jgi:hypothetical protein
VFGEIGLNFIFIKFSAIVSLDNKYGQVNLGASIPVESGEGSIDIGFFAKRKGPKVMGVIIHNNKIIAKPRSTRYR